MESLLQRLFLFWIFLSSFPDVSIGWKLPFLRMKFSVDGNKELAPLRISGSNNFRYSWPLAKVAFSLLPLYPSEYRKTIAEVIIPNKIWTFDQLQGIFNVNVPVRSVVIKLKDRGLFVYNPVAPTIEFIEQMKELEKKHGKVKYIVLGTVGLEHKVFVGSFASYFPTAIVYIQPGQWSFPFDLPNIFLGFPIGKRLKEIPQNKTLAPWINEFDYSILGPLRFKSVGGFSETVFFHKETKTLLVTDLIVKVGNQPPPIIDDDPRALLYHSRDSILDEFEDTPSTRQRGWRRMALFGLTFFPSGIRIPNPFQTLLKLFRLSNKSIQLGAGAIPISGGLYPWEWVQSEERSFQSLQPGIFIAPILTEIILNREADRVYQWAKNISDQWTIQRILPSHFDNNILTTSEEVLNAFRVLQPSASSLDAKNDTSSTTVSNQIASSIGSSSFSFFPWTWSGKTSNVKPSLPSPRPLPEDLRFLRQLSAFFAKYKIN